MVKWSFFVFLTLWCWSLLNEKCKSSAEIFFEVSGRFSRFLIRESQKPEAEDKDQWRNMKSDVRFASDSNQLSNTCKYTVAGESARPDSYQQIHGGKWGMLGAGGVRGAAHIWLSASRDEWLRDNRASAAGRKMIPRPSVAARHAAPLDLHLFLAPVEEVASVTEADQWGGGALSPSKPSIGS